MTVVWGWRSRGGGSRRERGRREFRGRRMWLFGGQAGVSEGVERGGRGGFGTAEDHESRKGLGAVSYRHAGETRFCRPFEIKRGFCGRSLSSSQQS